MLKRTRWVFVLALVAMLIAACGAPAEEPAPESEPAEAPAAAMPEEGAYGEAPMLAEMVAAGTLPPVDERLPKEPLVIEPYNEIGQYGGIVRRGFTGPGDAWNPKRYGAHDHILF